MVGDLIKMTNQLRRANPIDIHQDLNPCPCTSCNLDRTAGCRDPNKCCRAAQGLIKRLKPKWRPSHHQNIDGLSLTPGQKKRNTNAKDKGDEITFNPSIA
jgi:hypothetical protein